MNLKLLELALIAAVAFGLGFWQLYDVGKAMKDDDEDGHRNDRSDSAGTDSEPTENPDLERRN